MEDATLRAWWAHRQGLDGTLQGSTPSEVLERSGWARSVGGAAPYLTLYARAGTDRADADQAVARLEIHELPSARGCTYVVPVSDFALALTVGQEFSEAPLKTAYKLGVTESELDALCAAVIAALGNGPLEPDQIRQATGSASRSLGEEGKKKGVGTTLPLALGRLQASGDIRRVPVNGRLDQQRYQYALWRPNPLEPFSLSAEEAYTELARRYFRWIGPATLAEFRWFSGLGAKAGKAALEPLDLVPLEEGSDRLLFADDRERLRTFEAPAEPHYVLVSSLDAIILHRRDLTSLIDAADRERTSTLGGLTDLPHHAILDRGRLVGLWEYDVEYESIVWCSFGIEDEALDAAVADTERYIREQLGDARSYSLDSPKSRAPRLAALRAAAQSNSYSPA